METILKIMGAALGLLVPVLLVWLLNQGVNKAQVTEQKRKKLKSIVVLGVSLWAIIIWILALSNVLEYHEGDNMPRFVLSLVVPVAIGIILLASRQFRAILDSTPLNFIVGVQTFRLAGFAFLIIAGIGILPHSFMSAGYGDIVTGALAIFAALALSAGSQNAKLLFWGFNIAGLFDLLNVAYMLLYYYPIWYAGTPSSGAATGFSLVMIPAIAAPVALLLHIYSIRSFLIVAKPH